MRLFLIALLLVFSPLATFAQEAEQDTGTIGVPDKTPDKVAVAAAMLHPQSGNIIIGNGLAKITLPEGMGYLSPDQTNLLLQKVAGYTYEIKTLGAIVSTSNPIGSPASWYAILAYNEDGHVNDDYVNNIDPNALLEQINKENSHRNALLIQQGYSFLAVKMVNWKQPGYNRDAHVLTWGFETKVENEPESKLIYNFRFFGRRGMVTMLLMGSKEQLPMFEDIMPKLIRAIRFESPNRYEDFAADSDSTALYSMDDIITGHTEKTADSHASKPPNIGKILKWGGGFLLMAAAAFLIIKRARRSRKAS